MSSAGVKKLVGVWEKLSPKGGPQLGFKGATLVEISPLQLVCYGGFGGGYSSEAWLIDLRDDPQWWHIEVEDMPARRAYHSGVEWNEKLLIFGGVNQITLLDDCWQLEIDWIPDEALDWKPGKKTMRPIGHWTKVQTSDVKPSKRQGHCASILPEQDAMLLVGGYDGSQYLIDAWILNLGTNIWTRPRVHGIPPEPRAAHCMGLVLAPPGDTMNSALAYVYGGYNNTIGCHGDIVVLAIGHDGQLAWNAEYAASVQGPFPTPRYGAAAAVFQQNMYIFGGTGPVKSYKKGVDYRVLQYDEIIVLSFTNPGRPAWRLDPKHRNFTGARPAARHGHAMALASGDGFQPCLLVTGGSTQGAFLPRDPAPKLLRDSVLLSLGVSCRGTVDDDLTYVTTSSRSSSPQ